MDASQYKDYVLVLLFIKYVSDKYAGMHYAPITIPEGASFRDMVALKGASDIGDQINKKIVAPLVKANKLADMPDFNDSTKLGDGKDKVDRLTNLSFEPFFKQLRIWSDATAAQLWTCPPRSIQSAAELLRDLR